LADVPAPQINKFRSVLGIVQENIKLGVTDKCAKEADAHWGHWEYVFLQKNIDPLMFRYNDPVPIL
jgi:hypothetical protein